MREKTRRNLRRNLLITQIGIYAFITLHAILWYVFGIHVLTKLCPFLFADQVGRLELNFAILFWVLVFISTLFLGRAFCAWGCMAGAMQDFFYRFAKLLKIKPIKSRFGKWLLRFFLVALTLGFVLFNKNFWPSFYWFAAATVLVGLIIWFIWEKPERNPHNIPKYILLVQYLGGIIALWIALNVFQTGFTFVFDKYGVFYGDSWPVQTALVVSFAIMVAFIEKRAWCKYMCPIGMVLRMTSAIPFPKKFKVRATDEKCIKCGKCNKECLMDLKPMEEINEYGAVKNPNCINCLACVSVCPKNAIDFKANNVMLPEKQSQT